MPIYEYQCKTCGRINSILILKTDEEKDARCARCRGDRLVRVLSRFALHKTETQRLDELDTGAPRGDTYYKDDRNIGLWAKKRAKELGANLGPQFNETVERARSGKILDDYDP